MSAALQVFYTRFDDAFFRPPKNVRDGIEARVDEMGLRLKTFPHYRLTGSNRYRLRVGDYRIIYTFDSTQMSSTYWRLDIAERFIGSEGSRRSKWHRLTLNFEL